ncbi:MAG: hypothetical protein V3T22_11285, partial [Planctomycetota bacterium]
MAFDEDGRLFVVEMRGYFEWREEHLGCVRLLEDTDGDGHFDTSHLFAEGLAWPTAIACWPVARSCECGEPGRDPRLRAAPLPCRTTCRHPHAPRPAVGDARCPARDRAGRGAGSSVGLLAP